jgi:hypothetical protein
MKKYTSLVAAILASSTLFLATAPAQAGPVHVDLSVGIPLPVFVAPAPVYVQPGPAVVYANPGYYGYRQPWHDYRGWHDERWHERDYHHDDHHDHDEHHDHGWR